MLQDQHKTENKRLIRSFGRIKSRKLSNHKNAILQNIYPKYQLNSAVFFDANFINNFEKTILEIGFGYGDFLYKMAKDNPQNLYIGCEPHLNGIINILRKLEQEPLPNILLLNDDFRKLAPELNPSLNPSLDQGLNTQKTQQSSSQTPQAQSRLDEKSFFDQIFILFPDPWPKLKHYKRRLINQNFLDEIIYPLLKTAKPEINAKIEQNSANKDPQIIIATDHDDYKTWILSNILKSHKFHWSANLQKDWQEFPQNWLTTKYQEKAVNEGRTSIIIKLRSN